jgi:hypothetical protein
MSLYKKLLILSLTLSLRVFSQPMASNPTYKLPVLSGFPNFLSAWRDEISAFNKASNELIRLDEGAIPSILDQELPRDFLSEYGSLMILGLEAGNGAKDLQTWMRILRDLYPVIENANPNPPFRRSLKLLETRLKEPLKEEGLGVKKFLRIEIPKNASPWEKQLCERVIPWLHSAQLLAGRTEMAETQKKESLSLHCKLRHFSEIKSTTHFLQIAELPLPYRDPSNNSLLFLHPKDLYSPESLQRLQKIK